MDFRRTGFASDSKETGIGVPKDGKILLFHGTTTKYLAEIQEKGILPRKATENSNWKHAETIPTQFGYQRPIESIPDRVYLTDLWHYFFAFNAAMGADPEWYKTWSVAPIVLEVEVRVENLAPDEDYVHNGRRVIQRIHEATKKLRVAADGMIRIGVDMRYPDARIDVSGGPTGLSERVKVTWQDALEEYGCCAHIGRIMPSQIRSLTVLGDLRFYLELMGESHFSPEEMKEFRERLNLQTVPYYQNWKYLPAKGKEVRLIDLWKLETKYPMVSCFKFSDFKGKRIARFQPHPEGKCVQAMLVSAEET